MIEWKNLLLRGVISIIPLIFITNISNSLISDLIFVPKIIIDGEYSDGGGNITFTVKNHGSQEATELFFTFKAPNDILTYDIFSTENITSIDDSKSQSGILQFFAPRLSNGDGSFIQLITQIENYSNYSDLDFVLYSSFDQGSVFKNIDQPSSSTIQQISSFLELNWIPLFLLGIFVGVLTAIWLGNRTIQTAYETLTNTQNEIETLAENQNKIHKQKEIIKKEISKQKNMQKDDLRLYLFTLLAFRRILLLNIYSRDLLLIDKDIMLIDFLEYNALESGDWLLIDDLIYQMERRNIHIKDNKVQDKQLKVYNEEFLKMLERVIRKINWKSTK